MKQAHSAVMTGTFVSQNSEPITPHLPIPRWEFVCMVAALMALNAFAIDIMLPAMGVIGDHYSVPGNAQQNLLYAYMIGFGAPQLLFGPISDRYGRKTLLVLCILLYAVLAVACMSANSFNALLVMRFVQGVFSSGIRVIAVSIVRDLSVGRRMASIMSLVMTVFMIVPILAPAIGQGVMMVAGWKWMFGVLGVAGFFMLFWVQIRLPETLKEEHRKSLSVSNTVDAFKSVLTTRATFGYMSASGVVFGALFAFIASAEQIFEDVFHAGDRFAIWFAIIAGTLAIANFTNSKIVERFGMRRISHAMLILFIALSLINIGVMNFAGERLIYFLPLFALTFACFGMLGSNFSAIALEAQGNVAGTASAVYGFATTTVASGFGYLVSSQFSGSVTPILIGFAMLGSLSLAIVIITERGLLFERAAIRGGKKRS